MLLLTKRNQEVVNIPLNGFNTTGSMEEGSPFLVCEDASGFAVGNHVIVEIGGEAGEGLIETDGVGGVQEPSEPGHPWYYNYYVSKPKALCAVIIGKEGNTVQLDQSAYVSTTDAGVWFDNLHLWDSMFGNPNNASKMFIGKTVQFPTGKFAFSGPIHIGEIDRANILGGEGEGTNLYTPKGCGPVWLNHGGTPDRPRVARFTFEQHWRRHGWIFSEHPHYDRWGSSGISILQSYRPLAHDLYSIDWGIGGSGFHNCQSPRGFRFRCLRTEPHVEYTQWAIVDGHCDDAIFYDCRADSPLGLASGFEHFRSTNSKFIRCGGINATWSSGGSAGFLWDECWSTITEDAGSNDITDRDWSSADIMFVGNNVGSWLDMSVGGEIRNPRFIQEGPILPGKAARAIGIAGNPSDPLAYANVKITGTDYAKALISGSSAGGAHINSTAPGTIISGIRLIGASNYGNYGNIQIWAEGGKVENCVVDSLTESGIWEGTTLSGNMTNAEYEA